MRMREKILADKLLKSSYDYLAGALPGQVGSMGSVTPCPAIDPEESCWQTEISIWGAPAVWACSVKGNGSIARECDLFSKLRKNDPNRLYIWVPQQEITSSDRLAMVERGVAFVSPGRQVYIPHRTVIFDEKIRASRKEKSASLKPAAQYFSLRAMNKKKYSNWTATEFANHSGYTKAGIGQVFKALQNEFGIFLTQKSGKEVIGEFLLKDAELWEELLSVCRNPRTERGWVRFRNGTPTKSLCWLSGKSAISWLRGDRDDVTVFAIWEKSRDKFFNDPNVEKLEFQASDSVEIEYWSYSPDMGQSDGVVDPFSLYLSLSKTDRDRYQDLLLSYISEQLR